MVNLKTKKPTGSDEIPSFFVRKLASILLPYLCFLFSFAFEFGICLKTLPQICLKIPVASKLLELFRSIRQDPKMMLQTTARYHYLSVFPKFLSSFAKRTIYFTIDNLALKKLI